MIWDDMRWYVLIRSELPSFLGGIGDPRTWPNADLLKCRWPKNRALINPHQKCWLSMTNCFLDSQRVSTPIQSNPIYIHMRFTKTKWTDLVVSNLALFALFQSNRNPIHAFLEVGYFRAVAWWGNWKSPPLFSWWFSWGKAIKKSQESHVEKCMAWNKWRLAMGKSSIVVFFSIAMFKEAEG